MWIRITRRPPPQDWYDVNSVIDTLHFNVPQTKFISYTDLREHSLLEISSPPILFQGRGIYRIISRSPLLRYVAVGVRETFVSREHVPYDIWSVPRGLSSCHIIDINIVGEETSIRCQKTPGVVGLLELLISHYWRIMLIIHRAQSSIWCGFFLHALITCTLVIYMYIWWISVFWGFYNVHM